MGFSLVMYLHLLNVSMLCNVIVFWASLTNTLRLNLLIVIQGCREGYDLRSLAKNV